MVVSIGNMKVDEPKFRKDNELILDSKRYLKGNIFQIFGRVKLENIEYFCKL